MRVFFVKQRNATCQPNCEVVVSFSCECVTMIETVFMCNQIVKELFLSVSKFETDGFQLNDFHSTQSDRLPLRGVIICFLSCLWKFFICLSENRIL